MSHSATTQDSPISVPEPQAGHPEITMAPLIDVVFLLLIFFMVTTVFPDNQGLMIEKPESRQATALPREQMVFELAANGEIGFGGQRISTDDVERLVRAQLSATPGVSVVLQVDRRAATDLLIRVMDACKLGGAQRIGIAAEAVDGRG